MIYRVFNALGLLISLAVFALALLAAIAKRGGGIPELTGVVLGHVFAVWAVLSTGVPETANRLLRLYDRAWPLVFLLVLLGLWVYWHYHMQAVTTTWDMYVGFKGSEDSKAAMERSYTESSMMLFEHIWQLLFCLAFALSLPLAGVLSGRFHGRGTGI